MRKSFLLSVAFGLAAGLITFAAPAWADLMTRTVPMIGYPVPAADASCFSPSYGGVVNNCGSTKNWEMPMVLREEGGNGTLSLEVFIPAGNSSTRCQATTTIGSSVWSSGYAYSFPANGQILTSVYIPSAGTGYVTCKVVPSGQLWTVGVRKN
jgi:hypothetical protein